MATQYQAMNTINEEALHQQQPPSLRLPLDQGQGGGGGASPAVDVRQTHLTKFAFLLSSARGEGSDEPVVGMHHDVEMAACFSERHLCNVPGGGGGNDGGWMMPVTPPSISSSSLSMQSKNGMMVAGGGAQGRKKSTLVDIAAMNMSTPFYTTPDTVSSTAKTILKNLVTTMEELIDSRLRSTISQLVNKSGGIPNSKILFKLLSPSRNPIQLATVITRFVIPDGGGNNGENNVSKSASGGEGEMLSIPLQFKAILDVKIFGVVSTVELTAPVTMSGKFDPRDGLLTAVDVSFDCVNLLNSMISRGRAVVKAAVTKAAALSIQIAEWHAKKKALSLAVGSLRKANQQSAHSLSSLLGSSISLNSMGSSVDGGTLSSLFTSFSSSSNNPNKGHGNGNNKPLKGLLRESSLRNYSRSLLKGRKLSGGGGNFSNSNNNANATFDFGAGAGSNVNALPRTTSTVRFHIPNTFKDSNSTNLMRSSQSTSASSLLPWAPAQPQQPQQQLHHQQFQQQLQQQQLQQQQLEQHHQHLQQQQLEQQQQQLQQQQLQQQQLQQQHDQAQRAQQASPEQQQSNDNGNIHQGLFSWLQDDKMFLTEEKIQEQNAADAERERKLREAPMPLRFFTAAEDLGGGECGLEIVSKSIFGGHSPPNGSEQQNKRRQEQGRNCHQQQKRMKFEMR